MLSGDFEAAWRVCDRVLAQRRGRDCSHWPRHLQHVWDGSPLEGKHVLVRCYHGLGDTLQFVRLLAPLRERARRITLWVQPQLLDLLGCVRGVDALLPLHDGAPGVEYDVDLELMEAAHALRLTMRDLPGAVPYLSVAGAPKPAAHLRAQELHVGIAWRSGDWDDSRSMPNEALATLARASGVRWFSLQHPPAPAPLAMTELGCRDIAELAGRMQSLDLVISVDTMTAHLAGALGLPVWTLLPRECDWRWMRERADSPWYPSMRLLRQRRGNEWDEVLDAVVSGLNEIRRGATRARDIRSVGCRASSG